MRAIAVRAVRFLRFENGYSCRTRTHTVTLEGNICRSSECETRNATAVFGFGGRYRAPPPIVSTRASQPPPGTHAQNAFPFPALRSRAACHGDGYQPYRHGYLPGSPAAPPPRPEGGARRGRGAASPALRRDPPPASRARVERRREERLPPESSDGEKSDGEWS